MNKGLSFLKSDVNPNKINNPTNYDANMNKPMPNNNSSLNTTNVPIKNNLNSLSNSMTSNGPKMEFEIVQIGDNCLKIKQKLPKLTKYEKMNT